MPCTNFSKMVQANSKPAVINLHNTAVIPFICLCFLSCQSQKGMWSLANISWPSSFIYLVVQCCFHHRCFMMGISIWYDIFTPDVHFHVPSIHVSQSGGQLHYWQLHPLGNFFFPSSFIAILNVAVLLMPPTFSLYPHTELTHS